MTARSVLKVLESRHFTEGAGVRLRRAFGHGETEQLDPFLMLDHFRSSDPRDYEAGFPFHPHRGIETVTYVLHGHIEHQDSLGNRGSIGPGDVQWMTAGSGILHQEMPRVTSEGLHGFQLWVNLPRTKKMMPPRYRDVRSADIPWAGLGPGARGRVIAGSLGGRGGPVRDLVVEVGLYDVELASGAKVAIPAPGGHHAFAYVFEGEGLIGGGGTRVGPRSTAVMGAGGMVELEAGKEGCRCLMAHGAPLNEPIAWGGPIVMSTKQGLDEAFEELRLGTFIRPR